MGQNLVLPSELDIPRLAAVIGEWTGVSIHFNPQKVAGQIRLDVRQPLDAAKAWSLFNQVLMQYGFTTVVAGDPAVYHIVSLGEAEATGLVFTSPKDAAAVTPPPGSLTIVQPLTNITPEAAIQVLGAILGQKASARAIGKTVGQVLITGDRERVLAGIRVVTALDKPGNQVAFRAYQPRYAPSSKLIAALTAAWSATAKVSGRQPIEEAQLMPDGQRILVVASADEIAAAVQMLGDLDRAEPLASVSYRPEGFALEDVAKLIEQTILHGDEGRSKIVRDRLTNALVIQGTEVQHERIKALLGELARTPPEARMAMTHITIRHRSATDLATILRELATRGVDDIQGGAGAMTAVPTKPAASPSPVTGTASATAPTGPTGQSSTITVDPLTNTLVLLGQPRFIDQMTKLVDRLDRRQPQVQVEITLVSLSDEDSQALGIDWAASGKQGSNNISVGQLLGLSEENAGGGITDRKSIAGSGLTALVINPGDYAIIFNALATVNNGRNMVTSKTVVDNNAEATVDAVLQQPIGNVNSSTTVATTSYGGTSDAGTQIKIKPSIGAADQVQLTFSVSQSVFIGESTKTADGGLLPPPKRQDSLASVATVPDGHTIALGGLSSLTESSGHTGLPWISEVPLLGRIFRNETSRKNHSRFFLFLRADVLRSASYEDLKFRARAPAAAAGIRLGGPPELRPRYIE